MAGGVNEACGGLVRQGETREGSTLLLLDGKPKQLKALQPEVEDDASVVRSNSKIESRPSFVENDQDSKIGADRKTLLPLLQVIAETLEAGRDLHRLIDARDCIGDDHHQQRMRLEADHVEKVILALRQVVVVALKLRSDDGRQIHKISKIRAARSFDAPD